MEVLYKVIIYSLFSNLCVFILFIQIYEKGALPILIPNHPLPLPLPALSTLSLLALLYLHFLFLRSMLLILGLGDDVYKSVPKLEFE